MKPKNIINIELERKSFNDSFSYKRTRLNITTYTKIILQNLAAGVCGTDIDIIKMARNDSSSVLGHEGIAKILHVSDESLNYKVGDIVVYNPVSQLNQNIILGHSYKGIFTKYREITEIDLQNNLIIKIPSYSEDWYGALLEPLSVAIYAHQIINSQQHGQKVLIIGSGSIAHIIARYLQTKNYSVTVLSQTENRIYSLRKRAYVGIEYIDLVEAYKRVGGFDIIFTCSPRIRAYEDFQLAVNLCNENTIIDLVNGFPSDDSSFAHLKFGYKRILSDVRRINYCGVNHKILKISGDNSFYLTGHRGSNEEHFYKALKELSENSEYYLNLIHKKIKFNELGAFFNNGAVLPLDFVGKIMVEMS